MKLVASVDESYRLGAEGWILFVMSPLADEGAVLEQPYPIVTTGDHLAYGKSDWITMPNIESISTVVGRFLDEGAQTVALMGVLPDWWMRQCCVVRRKGPRRYAPKDM